MLVRSTRPSRGPACRRALPSHVATVVTCAGVESGKPTHFTVSTKGAGKAPLDVSFSSPVKDFDIIDNYDYSQTVKYTPVQQVRPEHVYTRLTATGQMCRLTRMLRVCRVTPASP